MLVASLVWLIGASKRHLARIKNGVLGANPNPQRKTGMVSTKCGKLISIVGSFPNLPHTIHGECNVRHFFLAFCAFWAHRGAHRPPAAHPRARSAPRGGGEPSLAPPAAAAAAAPAWPARATSAHTPRPPPGPPSSHAHRNAHRNARVTARWSWRQRRRADGGGDGAAPPSPSCPHQLPPPQLRPRSQLPRPAAAWRRERADDRSRATAAAETTVAAGRKRRRRRRHIIGRFSTRSARTKAM